MEKNIKSKKVEEPNIVKDFFIGGTHIIIADNYCRNKTSKDIDATLNRIAEIAENSFRSNKSKTSYINDMHGF